MKKILYGFLTLLIIGSLAACSSENNSQAKQHSSTATHLSSSTKTSTSKSKPKAKSSSTSSTSSSSSKEQEASQAESSQASQEPAAPETSQPQTPAPEQEAPSQEQSRTVYVARDGTADVYWYSMDNMPANTNKSRVVQMTEDQAIAAGKRHTTKEPY